MKRIIRIGMDHHYDIQCGYHIPTIDKEEYGNV